MTRNLRFLIDDLASGNPNFGEELYSLSFPVDIINVIIASSIKDFNKRINRKYMPQLTGWPTLLFL